MFENSPAFQRRDNCAAVARPEGTAEMDQVSRPFGTCSSRILNPALKCRAIAVCPSGTVGRRFAFTLIELLVVIAIIALLSGLIVNLLPKASDAKVRSRVRAEMSTLEVAIDYYKDKRGYYPPDNPANPGTNSLYYELSGTRFENGGYTTLLGDGPLASASVPQAFGAASFINCNSPTGADDAANYFRGMKVSQQVRDIKVNDVIVKVLGVSAKGPSGDFSPWFYNVSSPIHNPNSYDLWVEVTLSGQTRQLGNWKD